MEEEVLVYAPKDLLELNKNFKMAQKYIDTFIGPPAQTINNRQFRAILDQIVDNIQAMIPQEPEEYDRSRSMSMISSTSSRESFYKP